MRSCIKTFCISSLSEYHHLGRASALCAATSAASFTHHAIDIGLPFYVHQGEKGEKNVPLVGGYENTFRWVWAASSHRLGREPWPPVSLCFRQRGALLSSRPGDVPSMCGRETLLRPPPLPVSLPRAAELPFVPPCSWVTSSSLSTSFRFFSAPSARSSGSSREEGLREEGLPAPGSRPSSCPSRLPRPRDPPQVDSGGRRQGVCGVRKAEFRRPRTFQRRAGSVRADRRTRSCPVAVEPLRKRQQVKENGGGSGRRCLA